MDHRRSTLAIALSLGGAGLNAHAALTTSAVLNFNPGTGPAENQPAPPSGSWFSLLAGDSNADYYPDTAYYFPLTQHNGIHIGVVQTASGSHSGSPGCNSSQSTCTGGSAGEHPDIDNPWLFLGATGMHLTTSPITETGSTANGLVKSLDFSGWALTWNGIPAITLGGDPANFPSDTRTATLSCSVASCSASSTFTLDYQGHVPLHDPSQWGGVLYALHLEGHVSSASVVPLPAAAWLFGSGLAGLAGLARRRKMAVENTGRRI